MKPADRLTDELRNLILEHKPELLAMLPDTELDRLIGAIAAYHGFTPEQTNEARGIAAGDPDSALICYRNLAAKAGLLGDGVSARRPVLRSAANPGAPGR